MYKRLRHSSIICINYSYVCVYAVILFTTQLTQIAVVHVLMMHNIIYMHVYDMYFFPGYLETSV